MFSFILRGLIATSQSLLVFPNLKWLSILSWPDRTLMTEVRLKLLWLYWFLGVSYKKKSNNIKTLVVTTHQYIAKKNNWYHLTLYILSLRIRKRGRVHANRVSLINVNALESNYPYISLYLVIATPSLTKIMNVSLSIAFHSQAYFKIITSRHIKFQIW